MASFKFSGVVFVVIVFCFASVVSASDIKKLDAIPGNVKSVPGKIPIDPEQKKQVMLKTTACKKNAQDNMAIYTKWKSSGCPATFEVIDNYDFYYQRCMNDATINVKERQKMLADCICSKYANTAKQQNSDRLAMSCEAKPNPNWWNSDYNYHYTWCIRGANSRQAENYTNQRARILQTCKQEEKKDEEKTIKKNAVLSLQKQSENSSEVTYADIPYFGGISAQQKAKLLKVTNKTPYNMRFLSKFNSSNLAAKCSGTGPGIVQEFQLFPGQSYTFTNETLFAGKWFSVCTNSNKEMSLKLDYEYEVTQ